MRSMARRSRKSLSGAVKRKPSTSPFVPRLDLIFQAVKKSVSLRAGVLRGGPSAPEKIGRKPHSKQDYGCGEVLELRRIAERPVNGVHPGELSEEQIVLCHCVKHTRSRENHAIGRAERGNEDGEGYDLACPRSQNGADGSGRDGVARGGSHRTKREEIRGDGHEIEHDQNQGAQ